MKICVLTSPLFQRCVSSGRVWTSREARRERTEGEDEGIFHSEVTEVNQWKVYWSDLCIDPGQGLPGQSGRPGEKGDMGDPGEHGRNVRHVFMNHHWQIFNTFLCYLTLTLWGETVEKVSCSCSASVLICVWLQGSPGPAGPRGEKGEVVSFDFIYLFICFCKSI